MSNMKKGKQEGPGLGIGEVRGKGVSPASAPHKGNTGVGARPKSTKND